MQSIMKMYEHVVKMLQKVFKTKKEKYNYSKLLFGALVMIAVLLLIPLLVAGVYNHMSGDDWYNTRLTYNQVLSNHFSLTALLDESFRDLCDVYLSWSFTYTGCFLAYFMPAGFGDKFTWMHTVILLGLFLIGTYVSFTKLIKRLFSTQKVVYRSTAILIIIYLIEYMPSPFDAFYWFSGSINNLVGFIISIMCITFLSKIEYESTKISIWNWIVFGVGLFLIAGTSYAAILVLICSMGLYLIDLIFRKSMSLKQRIIYFCMFSFYLLCFLFAMTAPGNANRSQLEAGIYGLSAFSSIVHAYLEGAILIYQNFNIYLVIFLIIICILLLPSLIIYREKFRYPVIVTFVTYSIFITSFIPTLYASGIAGELRVRNIQFFYAILFIIINIIYYLGWYLNKKNVDQVPLLISKYMKELLALLVCISLILFIKGNDEPASKIAMKGIINGELQQFDKEVDEREAVFRENTNKDVKVNVLTNIPELFYGYTDLRDGKFWINVNVREFYHLTGLETTVDSE